MEELIAHEEREIRQRRQQQPSSKDSDWVLKAQTQVPEAEVLPMPMSPEKVQRIASWVSCVDPRPPQPIKRQTQSEKVIEAMYYLADRRQQRDQERRDKQFQEHLEWMKSQKEERLLARQQQQ